MGIERLMETLLPACLLVLFASLSTINHYLAYYCIPVMSYNVEIAIDLIWNRDLRFFSVGLTVGMVLYVISLGHIIFCNLNKTAVNPYIYIYNETMVYLQLFAIMCAFSNGCLSSVICFSVPCISCFLCQMLKQEW